MSDTGITSGTPAARATSRQHAVNIFALWVLQALLAIMFAMAVFAKVGGGEDQRNCERNASAVPSGGVAEFGLAKA